MNKRNFELSYPSKRVDNYLTSNHRWQRELLCHLYWNQRPVCCCRTPTYIIDVIGYPLMWSCVLAIYVKRLNNVNQSSLLASPIHPWLHALVSYQFDSDSSPFISIIAPVWLWPWIFNIQAALQLSLYNIKKVFAKKDVFFWPLIWLIAFWRSWPSYD